MDIRFYIAPCNGDCMRGFLGSLFKSYQVSYKEFGPQVYMRVSCGGVRGLIFCFRERGFYDLQDRSMYFALSCCCII